MTIGYVLPKRWRQVCRVGQGLCIFVMALALWGYFYFDIPEQTIDRYWELLSPEVQAVVTYSSVKKALLVTLATISYFAPTFIVVGAFLVFGSFAAGEVLTSAASRRIRFLGITILAYALSQIFFHSLMILALTYDNPSQMKVLALAVNNQQIVSLMIGIIIILIGHIYYKASIMAEENKHFV